MHEYKPGDVVEEYIDDLRIKHNGEGYYIERLGYDLCVYLHTDGVVYMWLDERHNKTVYHKTEEDAQRVLDNYNEPRTLYTIKI